jgi:HK97 gp10 family phage protein
MAVQVESTIPRILDNGQTGSQTLASFVSVQTAGARDVAKRLEQMAMRALQDPQRYLEKSAIEASKPLRDAYKNNIHDITGNLRRSVRTRAGKKKYAGIGVAVTGPTHVVSGDEWDVEKKGAGNHAWLVEFGTGPRRPATQGRVTYLNVHQRINGKFNRVPNGGRPFNNKQFERMGRGFYFLMGSINVPERRTGPGAFAKDKDGNGTHPYFLGPGETYPAMTAKHPMRNAIQQTSPAVLNTLIAAMNKYIDQL